MYELVLFAIPVIVAAYYFKKGRAPGNLPPGPKQSLVLGNYKDVDMNRIHQCLYDLSKTYGPIFSLRIVSKRIVVLNSADIIRRAFRSETYKEVFNDKPKGFYGTYLLFGHQDVLFGPYKDVTFKIKSIMHEGVERFMNDSNIQSEVEELLKRVKDMKGADFDPREILENLIAHVHAKILTGDSQPEDSQLIWQFTRSSNTLLHPSVEATLKLFPFLRHLDFTVGRHYKTALHHRDRLLQRFFEDQKVTYKPEVTRGLVDVFLNIQMNERKPDGEIWLADDLIRAAVVDVIGAGVVAMANSMLALVLCLANNPECQTKMQAEIDKVVGKNRAPSGTDVTSLPYCHAVALESHRYNSIIPIINHCCSSRDVEFAGYCIPKGSVLFGCLWSAHHDEGLWRDPWNFRPDRFLDDKGRLLPIDHEFRRSLIPYGTGIRICTGKSFSDARLFVYATAVLQHFDILPPENQELPSCNPKRFEIGPVLHVPEFQCRLVPRSQSTT